MKKGKTRRRDNEFVCTAVILEQVSLHRQIPSFAIESVESSKNWTNVKLERFTNKGKHFVFVAEEKRKRGRGKGEN
jgi:hypothetical protein